jgi:hypothetical protein
VLQVRIAHHEAIVRDTVSAIARQQSKAALERLYALRPQRQEEETSR